LWEKFKTRTESPVENSGIKKVDYIEEKQRKT